MKYPEGKFIEQERRLVAAKNGGMWVEKGVGETANEYAVSFRADKNIPKLIVVMAAQIYQYTQIQWIVHIKWYVIPLTHFFSLPMFPSSRDSMLC